MSQIGINEPLIPYSIESKHISISEMKSRLSGDFFTDWDKPLTEAFKQKKIVGIALKGKEAYELPPVFWEVSNDSSFSVGAFNAYFRGTIDNLVDRNRISNLHAIQGWSIVVEEESFEKWFDDFKSEQTQKITEIFDSEPHWNYVQTLHWIMFRDPQFIVYARNDNNDFGTHLEEHFTPSGFKMVDVPNKSPRILYLQICEQFDPEKTLISYAQAVQDLSSCLQKRRLIALARKNNKGDLVEMQPLDWINATFYEDSQKEEIYVASKDHGVEIERTKWCNIIFTKEDIVAMWPASKHKASDALDSDFPYALPILPVHERVYISIAEAVSWMMFGDFDVHNQSIKGSNEDYHKQSNANVQKLLDAASVGQLEIWAENNGNKPSRIDEGTLKLRMKYYVAGDKVKPFPHNDELVFIHGKLPDSWTATQIRRDAFMNWWDKGLKNADKTNTTPLNKGTDNKATFPFNGIKQRNDFIKKEIGKLSSKGMRIDAAAKQLFQDNEDAFKEHGLKSWASVKRQKYR